MRFKKEEQKNTLASKHEKLALRKTGGVAARLLSFPDFALPPFFVGQLNLEPSNQAG